MIVKPLNERNWKGQNEERNPSKLLRNGTLFVKVSRCTKSTVVQKYQNIIVPLCTLVYKPTQESKARGIFSQVFRCRTEIIKEIQQNSSLVTPTNHPLQKPGKGCRSEVQPTKFGNNWKIITGNNLGIIFYLFAFVN